ncbi:MAG: four helix bundle protein [Tepidisphaeraceae bacterium]
MEKGENKGGKPYDLEERTERFAKRCRDFIKVLPRTLTNREDAKQLTRASGSVAANYLEANDSLSKKDFRMRVKICRKESKESRLFLRLLYPEGDAQLRERDLLVQEATELMNIFGAILRNSE